MFSIPVLAELTAPPFYVSSRPSSSEKGTAVFFLRSGPEKEAAKMDLRHEALVQANQASLGNNRGSMNPCGTIRALRRKGPLVIPKGTSQYSRET